MTSRAKDLNDELIETIVRQLHDRAPRAGADQLERFVRGYYDGVAPEDLIGFTADNLYGEACWMFRFAQKRAPNTPNIRVYNPHHEEHGWQSTRTIVEIVNDDMPFLVDSVAADLNRHDLTVHLLIHPILRVRRDDKGRLLDVLDPNDDAEDAAIESVLHVEVNQQTAQTALDALRESLERVLGDVRGTVEDFQPMRAKIDEIIAEVETSPPTLAEGDVAEGKAFLEWVRDDNFILLGIRDYTVDHVESEDFLRIVPDSGLGILRHTLPASIERSNQALSEDVNAFTRRKRLLFITKANTRSTVHRPVYMDFVGVRTFDKKGEVTGQHRILGLFTSTAYNRNPRDIPLLRHKVNKVLARSPFPNNSHNGKALLNILETYPRDELFQIRERELYDVAHGILHLEERQRIRLFIRRDDYARFFSCLIYVPRERYNTVLRERMKAVLLRSLKGASAEFTAQVSEAVMARLHFIVQTPDHVAHDYDVEHIEELLVKAARQWIDDLRDACVDHWGEGHGMEVYNRYDEAFPAAYRDDFNAQTAVFDIDKIDALDGPGAMAMNLYNRIDAADGVLNFKVYHPGNPVPLSDILPVLENMGLKVIEETPYRVGPAGDEDGFWIHDFSMISRRALEIDVAETREVFQDAFAKSWYHEAEDDGFNELVLCAGLTWREVTVLRAYCKYLRQAAITFSDRYMETTLTDNAPIARMLVELFVARFDPDGEKGRDKRVKELESRIAEGLDAVANLDEDRILRRFLNLVQATLRTNYFQTGADGGPKPSLAFKLDSKVIEELPLPRPWVDIFLFSPRVEAVHLRGGPVARGGLRWSDRREDFRTEILGLMKAQQVKNAVIVPLGSKGGFVVKRPPQSGGREAQLEEGIACYKTMIAGMLDITDNLVAGAVVAPDRVVRYDGDDPYLVVAADKGTATFSDIANGIAIDYGHWLGDAFASGGSAGYDHKGMGITARGAWESVKRHFREMGVDCQTIDFTCIGIGDMSGDVFGNGMLLSEHIRLIGAFNHLHIFLDPEPDAAKSFKERKRMFDLPRSTWQDYDAKLVSKGGGVYDRKAKSIDISPEVKKALGIKADKLTPNELIHAMVLAPVDLLWNGGIGTYVKAAEESHTEVGDRANDAIRVNGKQLRCRVVGEGGNLGLTQRGRIEYALAAGRIFTDAIDNSAGVDCSDHEVNIKILLGAVVADGDMTDKQRNDLLAKMTDEVGALVLRDNYQQTQSLSVALAQGAGMLGSQARLMRGLERSGELDREVEDLPDDEAIAERQKAGRGLTAPELSVLFAYSKMSLYKALLGSDLPEDPYLAIDLMRYFPEPLRERFDETIRGHQLRREIIATSVTNSTVNRVGITFVNQLAEEAGFERSEIARAYSITRDAFGLRELWAEIESLDNKVPSDAQTAMLLDIGQLVERCTRWFLRNSGGPLDIAASIDNFTPGIAKLSKRLKDVLSAGRHDRLTKKTRRYTAKGAPKALAQRIASLDPLAAALDIINAAQRNDLAVEAAGKIYFQVGERLGLDWLRTSARGLSANTHWQRQAVTAIIDDLYVQQRALTSSVIEANGDGDGAVDGVVNGWIDANRAAVGRNEQLLADLRKSGAVDIAMLTVANRQIRVLAAG